MESFPLRGSPNPELEWLVGRLNYDGSGVPSILAGKGFTIEDDGTGLFSVVTKFPWKVAWPVAIRRCVLAVGGSVQEVSQDPATRKVSFRILNDADAAEDPADGDGVNFIIAFQMTGLSAA